jgi:2-polyprenyl-6-methoxyphenol hydroxylase-like FAD-dependent oxidoreductase
MTAIALHRLPSAPNVRILERSPTPLLHHQGAGIVAGGPTQSFFERYDRTRTPIAVASKERPYLDREGRVVHVEAYEQRMTSWDLLYYVLRANFDELESGYVKVGKMNMNVGAEGAKKGEGEGKGEGEEGERKREGEARYSYGRKVTGVKEVGDKIEVRWSSTLPDDDVSVPEKSGTITSDMLIAADGPSSTIRSLLLPDVERKYVGYVAWRGTLPESRASSTVREQFVERFCFYSAASREDSTQILAYVIPGANGSLEPGERLINWVWYCTCRASSPQWDELFTDAEGKKHRYTLPVGKMRASVWKAQKAHARAVLPPQFADLVEGTDMPFIQAVTDVMATRNAFMGGKVLLVGDALAGFRPHTAASTSQAAYDAMVLGEAMGLEGGERDEKIGEMMRFARDVQGHGVRLGERIMPHLTGGREGHFKNSYRFDVEE